MRMLTGRRHLRAAKGATRRRIGEAGATAARAVVIHVLALLASCGGLDRASRNEGGRAVGDPAGAPSGATRTVRPAAVEDAGPSDANPPSPGEIAIELRSVAGLRLIELLGAGERRGRGYVQLDGVVEVSIANNGRVPVRLVHMDPANLVFTRLDTRERFVLLHPCEPGLLIGSIADPERFGGEDEARIVARSVFVLHPGETRVFELGGDWGCGGGAWGPVPSPGELEVEYRIHRLVDGWRPALDRDAPVGIAARTAAARDILASDRFWEGAYRSAPKRLTLAAPTPVRLDY